MQTTTMCAGTFRQSACRKQIRQTPGSQKHSKLPRAGRAAAIALLAFPLAALAQQHVSPPTINVTARTAGGNKTSTTFDDLTSDSTKLGTPDVLAHSESSLLNLGVPVVPFLFSEADASGPGSGAYADSNIIYQIQYSGPQDIGIPIVIHVSGLSTTVSRSGGAANSFASSTAYMTIANNDAYYNNAYSFNASYSAHALDLFGSPLDTGNNFLTDTPLITRANTGLVTITMETIANTSSFADYSGQANAQLDPFVYIDPSFPDAGLYTLHISAGVANGPAPESGTLLVLAAASVVFIHRRRALAG